MLNDVLQLTPASTTSRQLADIGTFEEILLGRSRNRTQALEPQGAQHVAPRNLMTTNEECAKHATNRNQQARPHYGFHNSEDGTHRFAKPSGPVTVPVALLLFGGLDKAK
jgi:hypothetical protein